MHEVLGTTISGLFWKTDNSTSKYEGSLAIDENGSARLTLGGDPRELRALDAYQRFNIHGEAEGEAISLFDCFVDNGEFILLEKNARIQVNTVAIGALIDNLETAEASVLMFTTPEIARWTGLRALKANQPSEKQVTVKYRSKKTRSIEVGDATLQFSTGINFEWNLQTGINLAERHGVRIVFDQHQSISSIDRWVTKTCRLVSLALRCSTICRVYSFQRSTGGRVTVVTPWSGNKTDLAAIRPLFTRPDLAASYAKFVRGWFAKYENLEPVISLRIALLSQPAKFREFEFLIYVQALEALHRRTRPARTIVAKAQFSALRRNLVAQIPSKWKTRSDLVDKLAFINEISLASRLRDMFADNDHLAGKLFHDTKRDIALIKDIRNYLTHYEGKRKQSIEAYKATVKFTYLTWKVRLLLEISILRATGLSRADVQKIIERSSAYRHLVRASHI
ncbi:hypothetical protein ACVWZ4_003812 [Bradyrhizobium sp. USDA 4472]